MCATAARLSARLRHLLRAERYEHQDEFWSSYRSHFLGLTLWKPAASAASFGNGKHGKQDADVIAITKKVDLRRTFARSRLLMALVQTECVVASPDTSVRPPTDASGHPRPVKSYGGSGRFG
jgi:hypothetical protein